MLPRTERLTELYFADDTRLPVEGRAGSSQKLAFTVNNIEHQTTTYRYKLLLKTESGKTQPAGGGTLTLAHDKSKTINETVKIPATTAPRLAVEIQLEYEGVARDSQVLSPQQQSIRYWTRVVGART